MYPDPLVSCPWLADDPDAFRMVPQAELFAAQLNGHERKTLSISLARRRGVEPSAESPAKLEEESFVSALLASGLLPWFTAQIEDVAAGPAGLDRLGWWKMLGLTRQVHLPELSTVSPRKPGDFDLILGPPEPHLPTSWIVGVEFKRLTFDSKGSAGRSHQKKLQKATEQAEGMLKLGVTQAVIVPIVSLAAEPYEQLPFYAEGSSQRAAAKKKALQKIVQQTERIIPRDIGVLSILWDAPPATDLNRRSKVSLYKIRRPAPRRTSSIENRSVLTRPLERCLEAAAPRAGEIVRTCPSCRALLSVRPSRAYRCPKCGLAWARRLGA